MTGMNENLHRHQRHFFAGNQAVNSRTCGGNLSRGSQVGRSVCFGENDSIRKMRQAQ